LSLILVMSGLKIGNTENQTNYLWHFNAESLVNFMSEVGYDVINITNVEDIIRKNNLDYSNILTGVFKKK